MEQKTPLYDRHAKHGGKMISYAGYLLPVQYSGVIEEHMAVRERAGIFDVSHMGEVIFSGSCALQNLNRLFTNDFTGMADGSARYSPMCNENGGVVDDAVIYRISAGRYMVVLNAANRQKDVDFMRANLPDGAEFEDISDSVAQIALQGPRSGDILRKLAAVESIPLKYYTFTENADVGGTKCLVSRTGYTGETGYELYCEPGRAAKLWDDLLDAGAEYGLVPCGLGARDTLRLEAAMPLYGHEMTDDISPLETGLKFAVKLQKEDFTGKKALEARGEPKIARVGIKITGRGIAREHNPVLLEGRQIGETTSGTYCPYLGGAYAMALVETHSSSVGTIVQVEVRGRTLDAKIVPLPFYKKA